MPLFGQIHLPTPTISRSRDENLLLGACCAAVAFAQSAVCLTTRSAAELDVIRVPDQSMQQHGAYLPGQWRTQLRT